MFGLPRDFDGTFLVGRTLDLVCFAQFQMYLHFGKDVIITVESAYSFQNDNLVVVPVKQSDLMGLIGATVSQVTGSSDGTLTLRFGDGRLLRIYDTSQEYESYSISYGDKVIVI
jgi:hypothetical protein